MSAGTNAKAIAITNSSADRGRPYGDVLGSNLLSRCTPSADDSDGENSGLQSSRNCPDCERTDLLSQAVGKECETGEQRLSRHGNEDGGKTNRWQTERENSS